MENGAGFVSQPRTRDDRARSNNGWLGGLICVAVVLVLIGASPFGDRLRRRPGMQSAPAIVRAVAGAAVSGIPMLNGY
jgi:hypothetical protein